MIGRAVAAEICWNGLHGTAHGVFMFAGASASYHKNWYWMPHYPFRDLVFLAVSLRKN
jgi:hypothetical protein